MKADIEFISAGAGSGKTHKLTETLAQALESGSARPHAVVATTFTVKAATELRERARAWLLQRGRIDLATALGQASVGTVNSVCGQWLQRFCFELGLPPDQTVLGEEQASQMLKATLAEALEPEAQAELVRLTERLGIEHDSWSKRLQEVLTAARANDIGPEDLRPMAAANADAMLAYWSTPAEGDGDGAGLTGALTQALATARAGVQTQIDTLEAEGRKVTDTLRKGLAKLRQLETAFQADTWAWPDWLAAQSQNAGASARTLLAPVQEAAKAHASHPQYHADVRRYLQLVFGLSADALQSYRNAKLAAGAVDFVDQEALMLHALRTRPEVRAALAEELDLVLVDEFQDTSPLQLALFVELAQLARRSVWVGDPKQAIYGFRGTDATLVAQVLQALPQWGGRVGEALSTSRRSTPALVSLTNAVFGHAFTPTLQRPQVVLSPSRQDIHGQPALLNWSFESRENKTDYCGLGPAVHQLLGQGLQVFDKGLGAAGGLRPLRPGDIGVLCRKNDQVPLAVAALQAWGVPAASPRAGLLGTAEALLVLACLRRLHNARDTVATALVLTLADGTPVQDWLADRLNHLSQLPAEGASTHGWQVDGATPHPLLGRLEQLRPRLAALSPSEALQLAVAESQVAQRVHRWAATAHEAHTRLANVEALAALGPTYEDECAAARRPATVGGLLAWLAQRAEDGTDERAAAAGDAVSVLTYHRAKGLEWPVAVLTALDATARSALWGVRARTQGAFDAAQPLARRFIHCWPATWGRHKAPQPAADAEAGATGQALLAEAIAENRRLLYVGLTRARDVNVLVSCGKPPKEDKPFLPDHSWVAETEGAPKLLFGPTGSLKLDDDQEVPRETRHWTLPECDDPPPAQAQPGCQWFEPRPPVQARPLWRQPSAADTAPPPAPATAATHQPVGARIVVNGRPDMATLGTALHLCVARAAVLGHSSAEETARILATWCMATAVDAQAVCRQVGAFMGWLAARWPGCPVRVETPIEAPAPDGTRLRGRIDLLVDTPAGWVLVDHKAHPGGTAHDEALATTHAPQLAAYAQALHTATGRAVVEQWLYLPVGGRVVRVGV